MRHVVLGVIGHVDHGKTALVGALTGQDTDRLPEEKERGISIALGFAHVPVGKHLDVDLIDMPGHEKFVRTMVSGATGIDAVLLVVAADEGIRPQTIEHVDIAGLLGISCALVAVTKSDLATPERALEVAEQAGALLGEAGLEILPPVLTSARTGHGVEDLRARLAGLADAGATRRFDGPVYLPVDRAFTIIGHGPVVTGTLRGAVVAQGDFLELLPPGRKVRVRSVQVHGKQVARAEPGQRVALNLRNVEIGELERGMTLASQDSLDLSEWITVALRAVPSAPPLRNGRKLRALFGTAEVEVRLRLLDRDILQPGESGFAQLRCVEPVAVPVGERLVLRLLSPGRTVAGGRIVERPDRRERRNNNSLLQRLEQLRDSSPAGIVAGEAERAGMKGVALRQLSKLSGLAASAVAELLGTLPFVTTRSGFVVPKAGFDALLSRVPAVLARHDEGKTADAIQSALPGVGPIIVEDAIAHLLVARLIAKRGSRFVLPRPDEDHARAASEDDTAADLADRMREAGLAPPRPAEIAIDPASRRAVERLLRSGVLVRAVDRAKGKEIIFHRDALDDAKRRLAPLLARESGMLVTEIGTALGISRKYTMPLLDYLDSIRFTRRIDDRRTLHQGTQAGQLRTDEKMKEQVG